MQSYLTIFYIYKMKKIASWLILCFFIAGTNAQPTWQKIYGIFKSPHSNIFETTNDGGFIVTGTTYPDTGTSYVAYLMRLGGDGSVIWSNVFAEGERGLGGNCVAQSLDGGFAYGGNTYSYFPGNPAACVLKTDSIGTLLWVKSYDWNMSSEGFNDMRSTLDSGFLLVGSVRNGFGVGGALLVKIDKIGNVVWSKKFGVNDDEGISLIETFDHGFAIAGTSNGFTPFLIRIAPNGTVWKKEYQNFANPISGPFIKVVQTNTGGYALVCTAVIYPAAQNEICVLNLDSSGIPLWSYTYGSSDDEYPSGFKQTLDGGFVISGATTPHGTLLSDMILMKIDSVGNLQWSNRYGGTGSEDIFSWVNQSSDSGFIIGSGTGSFTTNDSSWIYLIKTDSMGVSGCNDSQFPVASNIYLPQYNLVPAEDTVINVTSTSQTVIQLNSVIDRTLCISTRMVHNIQNSFSIYPNPANDFFEISGESKRWKKLEIHNILGEKIYSTPYREQSTVNCELFTPGIYFVSLQTENGVAVQKLIKE